VIAHNAGRLGKELWTAGEDGEPIQLYAGFNEQDEARFIVEQIEHWIDGGQPRRSVAILYRSNAQSRVLEEALLRRACPTASTVVSASTSAWKSAMPWPTCACSSAAATTRRWSG
jgi:superfamily I DNA/RNA helicase